MSDARAAVCQPVTNFNIFSQPLFIFGVPVDRDTIFTDHAGKYKSRVEKRQRRLIIKTTFIKFFMHPNERILRLTTGHTPISSLEQMLAGPISLYFKRAIFVFTDQRILIIPSRPGRKAHSAISEILYDDCAQIRLKGHSLAIEYKSGQKELFPFMGRKERKKLGKLLAQLVLKPKEAGHLRQRVYRCPSCTNPLDAERFVCPTCKMAFKSGLKAKLRSLFIPGGGYLYSHHTFPGIAMGLLETALLCYLCFNLASLNAGRSINIGLAAIFGALYFCEKAIAFVHAQQLIKEFIPEQKDFAMRKI